MPSILSVNPLVPAAACIEAFVDIYSSSQTPWAGLSRGHPCACGTACPSTVIRRSTLGVDGLCAAEFPQVRQCSSLSQLSGHCKLVSMLGQSFNDTGFSYRSMG